MASELVKLGTVDVCSRVIKSVDVQGKNGGFCVLCIPIMAPLHQPFRPLFFFSFLLHYFLLRDDATTTTQQHIHVRVSSPLPRLPGAGGHLFRHYPAASKPPPPSLSHGWYIVFSYLADVPRENRPGKIEWFVREVLMAGRIRHPMFLATSFDDLVTYFADRFRRDRIATLLVSRSGWFARLTAFLAMTMVESSCSFGN